MKFLHESLDLPKLERKSIGGRRYYLTPKGLAYPSVTTALKVRKENIIKKWTERVGEQKAEAERNRAISRGNALHTICEKYLQNDENFLVDTMPSNRVLFREIQPIIDRYIKVVYGVEQSLYSDTLQLAGTIDLISEWDTEPVILDFKGSKYRKLPKHVDNYFLQGTCYAQMVNEHTSLNIKKIVIVMGCEYDKPIVYIRPVSTYLPYLTKFLDDSGHFDRVIELNKEIINETGT